MSLWSRISYAVFCLKKKKEIEEELQSHTEEAIAAARDPKEADRAFSSISLTLGPPSTFLVFFFFFIVTPPTAISDLSLHAALPPAPPPFNCPPPARSNWAEQSATGSHSRSPTTWFSGGDVVLLWFR